MLSKIDYLKLLSEQLYFLIESCNSFDVGFEGEGKRLAVTLRVLLHDTKNSQSLLGLMQKKGIPFCSLAVKWDPRNLLAHHGLLLIEHSENGFKYSPRCFHCNENEIRWIPFDQWWNELVFDDRNGSHLTRKDIVLNLADKEGGAHIDPRIDPIYTKICKENEFWKVSTPKGDFPLGGDLGLLSIRHLAFEVIKTIENANLLNMPCKRQRH